MQCEYCKKIIIKQNICPICNNKYCSEFCLSYHKKESHINPETVDKKINSDIKKSPYLIDGKLYKEIKYNEIFNIKNFKLIYVNGKVKLIGYGSLGKIFLGYNVLNKKYYAIKHINKKIVYESLHTLDTIYSEIAIQSKISHPNILTILYSNESEKSFDIIMEYAEKGSLFNYIQQHGTLSESKSLKFFIQIVNAIFFCIKTTISTEI